MAKQLCIFFLLLGCFSSSAQNEITISGTVLDINTQLPIASATVYFSNVKDSTLIEYTSSDRDGFFKITTKKYENPVFLKVNASGYQPFVEEQSGLLTNMDFGKLYLLKNVLALDEVVVYNDAPITIKKDTIEYNAASFKVRPDSNVETLLKQLPGFEVDPDGKITVDGKEVTQLLVNGKPFFDKDGAMAMKNLPADIISKIQVSDLKTKKEELAKQESTSDYSSINITIDKKKNRGVFGKFLGGYGTDDRYESSFILNFFNDKQKISVLASSNNINATGFSMDDVFDNMSGGRNSTANTKSSNSGIGITQSNIAGINYSDEWAKTLEATGSYDYKNTENKNENKRNQVSFLPTGAILSESLSQTRVENTSNKANFELEYKINPNTRLFVTPDLSQSNAVSSVSSSAKSQDENEQDLNATSSESKTENHSTRFGNTFNFNKVFLKKNRNLSLVFSNSNLTSDAADLVKSSTVFFEDAKPNDERNQNSLTTSVFDSYSADIEYTEPITDSLRVRLGVDLDWLNNTNDLKTYDYDLVSETYSNFNALQSNYTSSNRNSIAPKAGLTFEKNRYTFTFNFSTLIVDYDNHSFYLDRNTDLNQQYLLPLAKAQIRYKVNRSKYFVLKYDYYNNLPTSTQLLPVANLSNPLNTIIGNPNLNPNEVHNAKINFKNYNIRSRIGYNVYLKGDYYNQEVVSTSFYDDNGKKNTTYVNVTDAYSTSLGGNWNKTIKNKGRVLKFGVNLNSNYSFDKGFTNAVLFNSRAVRITPGIYSNYDYGDLFTLSPSYNFTYNETKYENTLKEASATVLHRINLQTTNYWPAKWIFGNDFGYTYNSNISSAFKKDFYLWNSSLSYGFFEKKMLMKLKVYDILNQNQSATRTLTSTSIRDEENTVLKRYAMFSLTYKMGDFKGNENEKGKSKSNTKQIYNIVQISSKKI